jgi:hypothetical protein
MKWRSYIEEVGVYERIVLKEIFSEVGCKDQDWNHLLLEQGVVMSFGGFGKEPWDFVDWLSDYYPLRDYSLREVRAQRRQ